MFNTGDQEQLFESILFQTFGETVPVEEYRFVSGGCINNTVCLITEKGKLFIKWHESAPENMFEVEAMGLDLLKKAGHIKIPTVLGKGNANGKDYLIMEFIDSARPDKMYWENFGANLAHMHKKNTQNQYGLDHNNYIGRLPQSNEPKDDWIDFFIEKRLEVQVQLARYNGLVDAGFVKKFQKIYDKLPELLPVDPPSLIHGDMWSGNVMTGADGQACLIDPAVYYGHREIELSFTQMFGGFDISFYNSYNEVYPLQPGFDQRVDIYNMYPYLVHVNLFGTSYLSGVTRVLNRYL